MKFCPFSTIGVCQRDKCALWYKTGKCSILAIAEKLSELNTILEMMKR